MADGVELDLAKLAAALVKFQGSISNVEKTQEAGTGSYAYTYADLGAIWDAIRKPLTEAELAVTQFLQTRDDRHWIDTTVWHTSGQRITSSLELPLEGKKPQDAGSLITYYKRYTLGAALGIATEEDDDGKAVATQAPATKAKAPAHKKSGPSDEQLDAITDLAKRLKMTPDNTRKAIGAVKTAADADTLIDAMQTKVEKLDEAVA